MPIPFRSRCRGRRPCHHRTDHSRRGCTGYPIATPSERSASRRAVTYTFARSAAGAGRTVTPGTHPAAASRATLPRAGRQSWTFRVTDAAGTCATPLTTKPATASVPRSQCSGCGSSTPTLTVAHTRGIAYRWSSSTRTGPCPACSRSWFSALAVTGSPRVAVRAVPLPVPTSITSSRSRRAETIPRLGALLAAAALGTVYLLGARGRRAGTE